MNRLLGVFSIVAARSIGAVVIVGVVACNAIVGIREGTPKESDAGDTDAAAASGAGGGSSSAGGGTASAGGDTASTGGTGGGPPKCDPGLCPCGDGSANGAEECDDGGTEDGDGCSATCEIERVVMTSGGEAHTCALLSSGIVKCWGRNNWGQLGLNHLYDQGDEPDEMGKALPAVDLGDGERATAITAGWWHTCAILTGGRVKCWGSNYRGQLGLGHATSLGDNSGEMGDALPTLSLGAGEEALAIVAGDYHTCVRLKGGNLKCWGHNDDGQLGLGDDKGRGDAPGEMGDNLPYVDVGAGLTVVSVAAAGWHTCAVLSDESVKCWGWNAHGQLGAGDTDSLGDNPNEMGDKLPPVDLGSGAKVASVVAASQHTCAVLTSGALKCWGENGDGELGLGFVGNKGDGPGEMGNALPSVPFGPGKTLVALAGGEWHTCALLSGGEVKCWGWNAEGQLGLGDKQTRGADETVAQIPAVNLGAAWLPAALFAGDNTNCAISTAGRLKCWGENTNGELGLGDKVTRGDGPGEMGDNLPEVPLF